jgi:hypothetical protein
MKAGVAISPRGVDMTPARAAPSVAWRAKENAVIASIDLEPSPDGEADEEGEDG